MSEENDNLEDFVNENRDDFAQYEPSGDLWANIQQQMQNEPQEDASTEQDRSEDTKVLPIAPPKEEKVIKLSTLYRAAAVLVLGLGIGYGIWGVDWKDSTEGSVAVGTEENATEENPVVNNYYISLKDLSPELAEVEQFYTSQIQEKKQELQTMEVGNQYLGEIQLLDEEMKTLQREVSVNMDNERVVEAMVQNYRLRLELLEDVLEQIKNENETTNDDSDHPSVDS